MVRRWSPALSWGASVFFMVCAANAEESVKPLARTDALPTENAVDHSVAVAPRAPAHKGEPDVPSGRGLRSVLLGTAVALIPSTIGGAMVANGTTFGRKNVGFTFAGAGFVVAPLFAHGINGEWGRGALFCIAPSAGEIGMITIASVKPDAVFSGTTLSRTTFVGLFTMDIFTSAMGIVDAALIANRRRGHGIFARPSPRSHFALTGISPGAGSAPYGLTVSLSL